jgi:hypothetical protein
VEPTDKIAEVKIIFHYVLQQIPRRGFTKVRTKRDKFFVRLNLQPHHLDERGIPKAAPLQFAETQFLTALQKKEPFDGRLLEWKAFLNDTLLSEYKVVLDPTRL